MPITLDFLTSLQCQNKIQLKVCWRTAETAEDRPLWKLEGAVVQVCFSSRVIHTLHLKSITGENHCLQWQMHCHWHSLIHRRLKWKQSLSWPCLAMPSTSYIMEKEAASLYFNFLRLRIVSLMAAAGPVCQNLSKVVHAIKSTVVDFKGSLSKCLSLISLIFHTI